MILVLLEILNMYQYLFGGVIINNKKKINKKHEI